MTRRGDWYEPRLGAGMRRAYPHGQNMVMPIEVIAPTYEGEALVLSPDRDLLSTEHPLVRARPELFTPALSRDLDAATHERVVNLCRAAGAPLPRTSSTTSTRTTGGLRLPRDEDYRPLRLP